MEVKNRKIYTYIENNKLKIEELMRDYTNYIYTMIKYSNVILSDEDKEEIVLDVFLTLWKNQYKLDTTKSMSAYISGITKNLIKKKNKKSKINCSIDDYEVKLIDSTNIEIILTQTEKQKIIFNELELIKKEDKDIFIEYYYAEKSIKEISKQFHMSESKIKSKLFRIRKRLYKALNERGYGFNER